MTTITELKASQARGFSQAYASNAALQKLHIAQETEESQVNRLEQQLQVDSQNYQQQLRIQLVEYTHLEQKLEHVKNLLANNHIEKLQRMC